MTDLINTMYQDARQESPLFLSEQEEQVNTIEIPAESQVLTEQPQIPVEEVKVTGESINFEESLIKKYNPIIYFHPEEKYFPCSIDWLLKNSTLVDFNTIPETKIKSPTNRDMYETSKKYNFKSFTNGDQILSFGNELYNGEIPVRDVPCYVLIKKRPATDRIYIMYIYLYPYNGEYDILGIERAGSHPADLEHITVELNGKGELLRVMYSAHGSKDGRWVTAKEVPMEGDRIVAYVAVNGHGLYPKEGTAFRLFGVANDVMESGKKWDPQTKRIYLHTEPEFNIDTMGWTMFNGRLGGSMKRGDTSGISNLLDKNWYQDIDILDQNELKSPVLMHPYVNALLVLLKDIALFVISYFIIYGLLLLTKKILKIDTCGFPFTIHLITIAVVLLLTKILNISIGKIILRYASG
jgi:hypothetical protein